MDRLSDTEIRDATRLDEEIQRVWELRDRSHRAAIHRVITWMTWILAFQAGVVLSGCNDAELNFRRSLAVTATAVAGGYRALDKYDEGKVAEILSMSDRNSAPAKMSEYEVQLSIARKALATATDALNISDVGSKLYIDVKNKNWSHALQELLGIGLAVNDALGQFGIKVGL